MNCKENIPQAGNPRFCDIVISNRCLLKCKMCKSWQCGPESNELGFEEAKKFVQSLSEFVKEPLEINVMGGEPLWKDWCLDLCNFISKKGFRSIISTNAYLIDEDMAKKIADSGLNVLAISLESLNPNTHNYLRGNDNVFSKVMKAIEYLEKYCGSNLTVTILTIIMEKNLDEILELTEWVNNNKMIQNISFLALLETGLVQERHNWFKSQTYKDLWPQDTEKVYKLMDQLIRLRKSGYKIWNPVSQLDAFKDYYTEPDRFMKDTEYRVHDYIVDLDENGSIYLSGDVLGNVRENDLRQLWFSDKANEIRRKIDIHGPGKRCCVINFICTFPPDNEYLKKRPGQKTIEELQKELNVNPQNEYAHQSLGFYYKEQGEFDKAMSEFKSVLEINPKNNQGHLGIGFCYYGQREIEKAIIEFNKVIDADPRNENAHHGLGLCCQYSRKYEDAIDKFKKVLEINPDNEYAHQDIGYCYERLRHYDKAIEELQIALKINPGNEHALCSLGFCYKDLKQFNKAMDKLKQALAINPESLHCHIGLGFCYYEQRQINKAIDEFNQVIKLDSQNEHAHHGMGLCYQYNKQFDDALNEFTRVLEINPSNEYAHRDIGFTYEKKKQYRKAIDELKMAVKVDFGNEIIHRSMGFCYEELEQFDKAIDEFRQVLEIDFFNEYAHQNISYCYERLKQYDKAIDELQKALKIKPKNEHALRSLGFCYKDLKQFDKAIDVLNEALGINPMNEYVHQGLGYCYQNLKYYDKAVKEFEQAIKINPDNGQYHYDLGCCYASIKEFDMAINEFKKTLELNPDNKDALHAIESCIKNKEELPNVRHEVKGMVKKPDFCVIEVLHNCILECKMCNYWKTKKDPEEVKLQQLYNFVTSLKKFVSIPFEMNISGGEPLMKKGILDLIEFIADQSFRFSMVTNGYLIDKSLAKRIADSGLSFLAISLDSLDENIHDFLRGKKGVYRNVLEALEFFDTYRGRLQNITLQSIITDKNLDTIIDLVKWAKNKQVSHSFMAITRPNMVPLDSAWYKKDEFNFLWPKDISKALYIFDELIRLKKSGYRIDNPIGQLERFKLYFSDPEKFVRDTPCSLGDGIIHVNPKGDVYLCCEMECVGNIKEDDISDVWTSQKAESIREKIRHCQRNCAGMVNCYREAC